MTLETYREIGDLYLARGGGVNPNRPVVTGDVFRDVALPGLPEVDKVIVVAHPCSIRGVAGGLRDRILVSSVVPYPDPSDPSIWSTGHFGATPLPDVLEDGVHYAARFDEIGLVSAGELDVERRLACLSVFGINLLQQRLIWHLTRFEVPTFRLNEATVHVFTEVDLLEEWNDTVTTAGQTVEQAVASFDEFIRAATGGGRTLQNDLKDAQRRSTVRIACGAEAQRIATERRESGQLDLLPGNR